MVILISPVEALAQPGPPTDFTATAAGPNQINLSWTAPTNTGSSNILGYEIWLLDTVNNLWSRLVNLHRSTNYSHRNLLAGTTYTYRIRALNQTQNGSYANRVSATTEAASAPGAPTGLSATASGSAQINLSWTAPSNNGGAPITGYRIQVSTNAGSSWKILKFSTNDLSTTYEHTNLPPSTTRHYRVRAINQAGAGDPSNVDNATTEAASVPDAPTGLSATASGRTRIDLSWTAPSNNGGASITGYRIQVSPNGTSNWTDLVANKTGTSHSHMNLDPGTTRHYRVYAINSVGESASASSVASATTEAASVPNAPTGLSATASGRTRIDLSWTAPSDNGGASITGYRIQVSPNGTSNWTDLVANKTGTSHSHMNLDPGTTRHYRVYAINSVGESASASSVASATTEAASVPNAPTGLSATASGRTRIDLSWTAPSDNGGASITGYRIQVSPNGTNTWTDLVANKTGTSHSHMNLDPGTTRHYRVYAINSVGESASASSVASATTEAASVPNAPTGLSATASGRTRIDLSWTAPSDNGGASITGYRIQVSPNGTNTWTDLVANKTGTSHSHMNLDPGTTRHYRVYAINSVGESASASSVASATTEAASVPNAPTGLSATASGRTRIDLSWTAPSDNGGASITGYRIQVSPNGTSNWTDLVANKTGTSHSHMNLDPGTTRHYRVYAINSVGESASASSVASATTEAASVPNAPTGLSATASGRTRIDLSWTAPSDNGGASITGYRIQVSPNAGTTWANREDVTGGSTTTYAHTGLTPGTTLHYRVLAINSVGPGNPSNIVRVTVGAMTAPDAPTGLTATEDGRTQINLSWTAPVDNGGSAINGYRIQISADAGTNWSDLEANTGNAGTAYVHTGLEPGTTRHYRVYAINSVGESDPSNVVNATTAFTAPPGAPANLQAQASGRTAISLSWTAPSNDGGATITGYHIELSTDAGSNWSDLVANTGTTSTTYTHTGLLPATTYHYRISAINAAGTGNSSNVDHATTDAASVSVPDAPTGLTATASGSTQIHLSWTAPSNDGGATITGYHIEMSTDAGANWSDLVANTESSATTYTHTGLPEGATRHYRVYAINSIGESDPSNVANATTGTAITRPDAPAELTAAASGRTQIHLSWTAPANNGGTAITGYRIEISADAGSNWSNLAANTESSATTYTHTGLPESATRHYRVYAINSVGESADPSNVAHATTDALSVPDAPTKLTASASGETEINLSWTAPVDDGGAAISGYQIEGSADAGETWTDLVADTETATTTYTHTGLQPGSTRHYRIRAINSVGAGDPSNVAHATTVILVSAPGVPVNVEAQADGQDAINLSWSAPLEDGGSAVTGYQVEVSEDAGVIWQKLAEDVTATSYRHTQLPPGSTRHYRILARNAAGLSTPSMVVTATTDEDKRTSIAPLGEEVPADFSLEQNYPNPFNPSTAIEFSLTRTGQVTLTVYDLLGQKVQTLLDGVQPAGRHSVLFSGSGLASDTYLYVLQTQQQRAVKMMTLLK